MRSLKGLDIVLGVTGGIAAYKACEVVSRLKKSGANVFVVMTRNACEFVRPLVFETLSGNPAAVDTFDRPKTWEVEHIALAKRAKLFVVVPATANIMAKMAHGIADDMLSTTLLATRAPILLAPAMNTGMWENEATRENVQTLQRRGVRFVGPEGGPLACGDSGLGRMSEPEAIVNACADILLETLDMQGLRVLVTAGPTRERIDPVRFLTNRSSGRMGYALAAAAQKRGAAVTLVTGPTALDHPAGVRVLNVESTDDLYEVMTREAPGQDIVIQAAAPADFKAGQIAPQKIKKQGDGTLTLSLVQTKDVAAAIGQTKQPGQTFVAFAAETDHVIANAHDKMRRKNVDLMVANDVTKPGAGFDVSTNLVTLIDAVGETPLPLLEKTRVADCVLDKVLELRGR